MLSTDVLTCEKCGQIALVVHHERPLCVECLMAQVAQSREQRSVMRDVKPIRSDQLKQEFGSRTLNLYR